MPLGSLERSSNLDNTMIGIRYPTGINDTRNDGICQRRPANSHMIIFSVFELQIEQMSGIITPTNSR
jgi:hypothetical protein